MTRTSLLTALLVALSGCGLDAQDAVGRWSATDAKITVDDVLLEVQADGLVVAGAGATLGADPTTFFDVARDFSAVLTRTAQLGEQRVKVFERGYAGEALPDGTVQFTLTSSFYETFGNPDLVVPVDEDVQMRCVAMVAEMDCDGRGEIVWPDTSVHTLHEVWSFSP